LVSTLFDTDVEKNEPRDLPLPISSKRAVRKSLEFPRSMVIADSTEDSSNEAADPKSCQEVITVSKLEVIKLDEGFIDSGATHCSIRSLLTGWHISSASSNPPWY